MCYFKYLRRDIRQGIVKQYSKMAIIIVVVVFMFIKMDVFLEHSSLRLMDKTAMDVFFYMFQGMDVYNFDPQKSFNVPMLWIVFNIMILYFTAYYPSRDCGNYGKTIFMAGKSRTGWWISKMTWCALSVIVCYAVAYISIITGALLKGYDIKLDIKSEFLLSQYGGNIRYLSIPDVAIIVFILPIVVSVTMCEVQMLLSFVISPVVSFAFMCGLYVLSAFYTKWELIPNFAMWKRSAYYSAEGLRPLSGFLVCVYLIIAVLVYGEIFFKNKDIL